MDWNVYKLVAAIGINLEQWSHLVHFSYANWKCLYEMKSRRKMLLYLSAAGKINYLPKKCQEPGWMLLTDENVLDIILILGLFPTMSPPTYLNRGSNLGQSQFYCPVIVCGSASSYCWLCDT